MCTNLPDIPNGSVELSGTGVGATATYTCITGYILEGNSQRTCQNSGQWSDQEPSCRSKHHACIYFEKNTICEVLVFL